MVTKAPMMTNQAVDAHLVNNCRAADNRVYNISTRISASQLLKLDNAYQVRHSCEISDIFQISLFYLELYHIFCLQ